MTDIPLITALIALTRDLRYGLAGWTVDGQVDLGLAATPDGYDVRWTLASPGDPAAHHVRFNLRDLPDLSGGEDSGWDGSDQLLIGRDLDDD